MEFTTIILEKEGHIAKITLNRPEAYNAVNDVMLDELCAAANDLENDDNIRVVLIIGKGRGFSAGADLAYAKKAIKNPALYAEWIGKFHSATGAIAGLSKPVIGVVHGLALAAGVELTCACDLIIAADTAKFGDQHVNFGLTPGGGNSQRLPRLIGIRRAKELLFTGSWLTAQEAERIGLVNKVVPADELEEAAYKLANQIAEKSPVAAKAIKSVVHRGMQVDINTAMDLEAAMHVLHMTTSEDAAEGLAAFEAKRKPDFKGK